MRLAFADAHVQALCADAARAAGRWGSSWTAVAVCLSLLMDSEQLGDLHPWIALEVSFIDGLVLVRHMAAVVTLRPLGEDGSLIEISKEDAMQLAQNVRQAQVVDITCDGTRAVARRAF
jgi:hypothetical protein